MNRLETPSSPLALFAATPPPAGTWAGSDPLVLGHALGSDHRMWQWVLPLLSSTMPVILWDQPGHGDSALLDASLPDATDVAKALDAALGDLGVERANIAGLSLGGTVSLAYAQVFPEKTLGLGMLDSAPANPPRHQWIERAEQVERSGLSTLADPTMQRWFTPRFIAGTGASEVTLIKDIFLHTNPAGYAQCCRVLANTDLWERLARAEAPSLVLTGVEDPTMTPEAAEALARYLPNAGEPVIVADARHLTAVQQPQVVATALVEMVEATY